MRGRIRFHWSLLMLAFAAAAGAARADTLWITSASGGNAVEMARVQITGVRDGRVLVTSAGRELARDVKQVARVQVDNEPALNAAEAAMAAGEFDVATDHYRKALASGTKDWVKVWSAQRLSKAAQSANRFDAAASGYIALVLLDPASAGDAKPGMPEAQSTFLNTAIAEVNAALATPGPGAPQKQALQAFLLELQRARGDAGGAAKTNEQMLRTGAATGADANAAAALVKLRLDAATAAVQRKDYPAAVNEITGNAKLFAAPRDQAQALYLLAEARLGIAGAQNTPAAWQDAALSYMRVVAHFKETPGAPYVAASLLRTAQIEEHLKDLPAARALYEQIVTQFPADAAATEARAASERLKAKP